MKTQQKGFTLVELVVVIVILGILAATALPKFVDMGGDARKAVIKTTESSMRAANATIYAKAVGENKTGVNMTVSVGTSSVAVNYGFARALVDLQAVMDLSSDVKPNTDGTQLEHQGAVDKTQCGVTYAAAAGATKPPAYTLLTNGC